MCGVGKLEDARALLACASQQESKLHLAPRIEGDRVLSDHTVQKESRPHRASSCIDDVRADMFDT